MKISLQDEWKLIASELKGRFLRLSIDLSAPRRLFRAEPQRNLRRDVVAGLMVSILAVPQAMAFAVLAGVPPIMGLYSIVFVDLVAGLWGHSPRLSYGPSNTLSLMLAAMLLAHGQPENIPLQVALIAVVVGAFQIACAFLGAGGLTKYVSRSVIVGYTSAIGLLIFLNQIPNLIGTQTGDVSGLFAKVWASLRTIPEAEYGSVLTGAVSFLAIPISHRLLPKIPIGFSIILAGGLFAGVFQVLNPGLPVRLVADIQRIPSGLPHFILPSFSLESVYEFAGPAVALGLLGCIEVSTISKNLAMRLGERTNLNQDIFGLGLGNLVGAFFGAMPGSGSFTRSEFALRCGVSSRWGMVFSSLFGLLAILLAPRLLERIPIPSIAALIMWLSMKLVKVKHIRVALFSTHSDGLVFLSTFFAALFLRLDSAIYIGVLVSMALFLQKASVPRLVEFEFDKEGRFRRADPKMGMMTPQISIIHVEGELFFGAAESIQDEIWRCIDRNRTKVVVLRLRNAQNLDASGVMVLEQLINDLKRINIHLLISGTTPEIDRVIYRAGLDRIIGKENYFPSRGNFLDATRRAVLRANEIVGVKHPEIRLFYDENREEQRKAAETASAAPKPDSPPTESK